MGSSNTARPTAQIGADAFAAAGIIATKTIAEGDFVQIGTLATGTVAAVSLLTTTLITEDGSRVTLPNSAVGSAVVRNRSRPAPPAVVAVAADYTVDAAHAGGAAEALEQVLRGAKNVVPRAGDGTLVSAVTTRGTLSGTRGKLIIRLQVAIPQSRPISADDAMLRGLDERIPPPQRDNDERRRKDCPPRA